MTRNDWQSVMRITALNLTLIEGMLSVYNVHPCNSSINSFKAFLFSTEGEYSGTPPYDHLVITTTFFVPAKRPYISS